MVFLYKMVRNIIGTLIDFSFKSKSVEDLKQVLLKQDRSLAGPTAPACGLTLITVDYGELLD